MKTIQKNKIEQYWNHSNYILVPNNDEVYLLGGRSMIEASDLLHEKFNIIKFDIEYDGINIESIQPDSQYKSKKLKKTLLFNNESNSDLCYLYYKNPEEKLEKIYGLCTTYDDPHELEVLEYDCKRNRPCLKNLRINYRPVKYLAKVEKFVIP